MPGKIHFQVAGRGNAVTLLHAMGASSAMWHRQVEALSIHYKIITCDIRGFGRSVSPLEYTMDTWVEDLRELLASLKIGKTCLLGFSMGGLIASRFALGFPGLLQGLVLAGTLGELREQGVQLFQYRADLARKQGIEPIVENTLNGFAEDFRRAHPGVIVWYSDILRKNSPENYAYACKVIWESAGELPLDRITCPVLVLRGAKDLLIPLEAMHPFKERVSPAVIEEIPDCAHFAPIEKPEAFNTLLEDFLKKIF